MGAGLAQSKKSDISSFVGMKVVISRGEEEREEGEEKEGDLVGVVEGLFGVSGKFKIHFAEPHGLPLTKGKAKPPAELRGFVRFHKYIFDENKKMVQ
mmetsp:Transcript_7777/g.20234  ORF Transcript_7777/g.20234 Transcript_7777/m.20234 type:complete len:97 (+) Transcript_7777:1825-2115(+)